MLHISAINNGPSDFFWKPVKLCMAAVLMIWCMFTGHFRVGCCELPICKPLVANISTRSCVLLFCLGKYYASTASSMKFYWSVLTSYRYFWGSQLLWGVESPLTSEVMLECMDQLCLSALTSFTCIQVHDCCIVLRVGWPVKSCSAVLTSFTCCQAHDCCLVWRVSWPLKSCLNILTSFTCCQAHGYCLVLMSQLTSEVLCWVYWPALHVVRLTTAVWCGEKVSWDCCHSGHTNWGWSTRWYVLLWLYSVHKLMSHPANQHWTQIKWNLMDCQVDRVYS